MMLLRLTACLLALLLPCAAYADDLPIDTSGLPDAEQAAYIERMHLLPWAGSTPHPLIHAFDTDDAGRIALAFARDSGSGRSHVGVYDRDGAFLWGFSYQARSAHPVLLMEDGTLALLSPDKAILIGEGPACTAVRKYISGPEGTKLIGAMRGTARTVGEDRFEIRLASPLSLGYSTLVRIAPDGQETVLFDETDSGLLSGMLPVLILLGISAVVFIQGRKQRR